MPDRRESLADPIFANPVSMASLRLTGTSMPALSRAFPALHRAVGMMRIGHSPEAILTLLR
ncbi:hypothetical protein [Jannaschia helgolandensis]|uniref:hypothetical protein n=1 Tax=Jannaschia helgolandensis TaxID=188906 RepID=UPI0030DA8CF7